MMPDAILDMIEPDAKDMAGAGDGASDDLVALASIAISLRRLADALHYQPAGVNFYDHVVAIAERNHA